MFGCDTVGTITSTGTTSHLSNLIIQVQKGHTYRYVVITLMDKFGMGLPVDLGPFYTGLLIARRVWERKGPLD